MPSFFIILVVVVYVLKSQLSFSRHIRWLKQFHFALDFVISNENEITVKIMIQIYRTDKDKNNWELIAPHYDTDQFKTIMNYSITHTSNNKKMNWTNDAKLQDI